MIHPVPAVQRDADIIVRNIPAHSVCVILEHFRKRHRVGSVGINQVLQIIVLFLPSQNLEFPPGHQGVEVNRH